MEDDRYCIDCGGKATSEEREFNKDCPCGGGFMTTDGAVTFLLMKQSELYSVSRMLLSALRAMLDAYTEPPYTSSRQTIATSKARAAITAAEGRS